VRWYLRYALSYRDLEEMMEERGLAIDHTTIYRWVQRYAPDLEKRCRCPYRKPHPALKYLRLEGSSAILLDRPAHPFFDGLLRIYGPHLRSLLAHPEPDRATKSTRGRESRPASATGRPQPESSPAATAPAGSILLGDSLAALEELAAGLDHCQTGDRHQMA
jgi:hypothetical protein